MSLNLRFDPNLALVVFEYSGGVTMEYIIQVEKQLHDSLDVQRYNKQLDIYHTDVKINWNLDDYFHYKSKLGILTGYPSKMQVAVVTKSSFLFGIHRMFDIENKMIRVYTDHMTFYALDEACDWLNIPLDIIQKKFQHQISK